jgi:hypothetical protein
VTRHQDDCRTCASLRERAPASDPEDCPDLALLQNLEAVRLMGGGPVRPSQSLQGLPPDLSKTTAERMAARRAELAPTPTEAERPRCGKES